MLQSLACDKMSVSAVVKALGVSWDVANSLALSMVRHLVYDQPGHLDGVRILGVHEAVFAEEQHIDVEVAERIYQDLVAAYSNSDKRAGKLAMFKALKRVKPVSRRSLQSLLNSAAASGDAGKRSWRTSIPAHPTVGSRFVAVSRWVSTTLTTTSCGH